MYKLIALYALATTAFAKPGFIQSVAVPGATVAAPAVAITVPQVAVPASVSYQSRQDVVHPGAVTYSAVQSVPFVAAAPVVAAPAVRVSGAVTSRLDLRNPSVVTAAVVPLATGVVGTVGNGLGYAGGRLGLGGAGIVGGILGSATGAHGLVGYGYGK